METIDTLYEFAGYQGAIALAQVLSQFQLPLLVALGGVAWRVFRVAEEGLARPLAIYVFSLVFLSWLLAPTSLELDVDHAAHAPRFLVWLNTASDRFTSSAIDRINADFLKEPYRFERAAAMCGVAGVYDEQTRDELHLFFRACTTEAIAHLDGPARTTAEQNPLRDDTGLPYDRFTVPAEPGVTCEAQRQKLAQLIRAEMQSHGLHKRALSSLHALPADGRDVDELYFDQIVRNEWRGLAHRSGEMAAVRAALGTYDPLSSNQITSRMSPNAIPMGLVDYSGDWGRRARDLATGLYAQFTQPFSDATQSKQLYYTVTTLAPELYGLILLLLLALFPIAGLWSLFPGHWTALVYYGKTLLSVKLWPLGWAILSSLSQRKPASEAFHVPGAADAGTTSLFASIVMMYLLVPVLTHALVNIATSAVSLPLRSLLPTPAGGNPAREVIAVASRVR